MFSGDNDEMSIQIIETIKKFLGLKPKICGLCPSPIGEKYYTLCFKVSDDPEIQHMLVCPACMEEILEESERTRKHIKGCNDGKSV